MFFPLEVLGQHHSLLHISSIHVEYEQLGEVRVEEDWYFAQKIFQDPDGFVTGLKPATFLGLEFLTK